MFDGLKDYIEAAVFALVIGLAVYVTHWIDSAKLTKVEAAYATQESARNVKLLADYGQAVLVRDGLQKTIDTDALAAQQVIQGKNNEIDILNARLNAGSSELRIKASCPAIRVNPARKLSEAPGPDTSGYARLDADTGQTYIALRRAIVFQAGQIAACKSYAAQMVK